MIVPRALGNVDPEWTPPRGNGTSPGQQPMAFGEMEVNPNPAPKKCIWAMLLLSSLLVLRMQQERYAEAMRWRGGVPESGSPFPWETYPLVSMNDSFEATFLAPVPLLRRASSFQQPKTTGPMVITGLTRTILAGGDSPNTSNNHEINNVMSDVSAVLADTLVPPPACPGNEKTCYVAVQRVPRILTQQPSNVICHRFVIGSSLSSMRPMVPTGRNGNGTLCLNSKKNIHAAVPTAAEGKVVLAWEPPPVKMNGLIHSPFTCLAAVVFPGMDIVLTAPTSWASTVLFDNKTGSIFTIGFSREHTVVVYELDAATLRRRWRYRLPLSVAWLLRAPRVSDGYLLFVGSEQPFIGTIFVIDLLKRKIYEQDPPRLPNSRHPPQRRRLPEQYYVEQLPDHRQQFSHTTEPCAAVAPSVVDRFKKQTSEGGMV